MCLEVVGWRTSGGRAADGTTGYRHIAECRTGGGEGPGALVDMGVARDPQFKPVWGGGQVAGIDHHRARFDQPDRQAIRPRTAARADAGRHQPAQGLQASARPSPENVPNNHIAYAGQWFFFALAAGVIYFLALRRRAR